MRESQSDVKSDLFHSMTRDSGDARFSRELISLSHSGESFAEENDVVTVGNGIKTDAPERALSGAFHDEAFNAVVIDELQRAYLAFNVTQRNNERALRIDFNAVRVDMLFLQVRVIFVSIIRMLENFLSFSSCCVMLLSNIIVPNFFSNFDFLFELVGIEIVFLLLIKGVSLVDPLNGLSDVPVSDPADRPPLVGVNAVRAGFLACVIIRELETVNEAVRLYDEIALRSEIDVVEEEQEAVGNLLD